MTKSDQVITLLAVGSGGLTKNQTFTTHGVDERGDAGGIMADVPIKDYLDAKIDAVVAQNEARFSRLDAKIDALGSKVDAMPRPLTLTQYIVGGVSFVGATLGIVFAVLSYASDRFDGGLSASSIKDQITAEQVRRDAAQDAKLDAILEKIDSLAKQSAPK